MTALDINGDEGVSRPDLNELLVSQAAELAREHLDNGYTCSQAVLLAVRGIVPRLSSADEAMFAGFGGGFGRTGRVCGAVVAATVAVSAAMMDSDAPFEREELNLTLQRLYRDIEAEYGSLDCRQIVGLDFRDPEQSSRYRSEKHEQVCRPLVGRTVALVGQALKEADF